MPKKTPLEQFIAETGGDRRASYEARKRKEGNRKITVWVPEEIAVEIRDMCSALVAAKAPAEFSERIRQIKLDACVWKARIYPKADQGSAE